MDTEPAMASSIRVRSLQIPRGELHSRFSRSSGPGGQGVNTADSRVELSYDVQRSSALPNRCGSVPCLGWRAGSCTGS